MRYPIDKYENMYTIVESELLTLGFNLRWGIRQIDQQYNTILAHIPRKQNGNHISK